MEITSSAWGTLIKEGAASLGVGIGETVLRQFREHAVELVKWNRRINLTAIDDPYDMAVKHYIDSIAPAPFMTAHGRLLDIGSGAGFPGIPLKCLLPGLDVLLIDASRKKTHFLNQVIRKLGLRDIQARHTRAEELPSFPESNSGFDMIMCRAFGNLERFVTLSLPLLAPGGRLIAMQGKARKKGMMASNAGFAGRNHSDATFVSIKDRFSRRLIRYQLPFLKAERSLVIYADRINLSAP